MGDSVVYIVAKAPRPGQSKTRLCPPLLPEAAADLAAAFLRDTIGLATRTGADVRLIVRDAGDQAALRPFATVAGVDIPIHVQRGPGLGQAMESAFALGVADGYQAVAVVGTDCPSLPPDYLTGAFDRLRAGADVALGPSPDGGYYLLAARRLHAGLFRDMAWSTPEVLRVTLARGDALGLRVALLEPWQDVDDFAGLRRLAEALAADAPDVAPHTRAILRRVDLSFAGSGWPRAAAADRHR